MNYIKVGTRDEAVPLILWNLKTDPGCDVWIDDELCGYWASIKGRDASVAAMSDREFKRHYRKMTNPQPYDIEMTPWPSGFYRGYDCGKQTSAF